MFQAGLTSSRYTRQAEITFRSIDVLMVPTTPTHFTIEQVHADPIATNSFLGEYAHFANVLDLCAISVPAGTYDANELSGGGDEQGLGLLPFSVTLLGASQMDAELLDIAGRYEETMR